MKSRVVTLLFLLCSVLYASAQAKIGDLVSSKYDRNSVSYIYIMRGGDGDNYVNQFRRTMHISQKYDVNNIQTTELYFQLNRPSVVSQQSIINALNSKLVGKEIISFIYNRSSDGTFNDKVITSRGKYNAKDQDVKIAQASKVRDLSLEWGEPLVNSSYIVVLDFTKFYTTKDKKGKITYNANVTAHAYKLIADRDVLDNFYEKAWADESSSEEEKKAARRAFDELSFSLEHISTVTVSGSSSGDDASYLNACHSAYRSAVFELENAIPAWQTASAFIAKHPLRAKIGTKEGVTNGQLFRTYSYKEDKNGNLVSVKRGYVRATKVANNTGVATGNTTPSQFYQISGFTNVQEGYTLKQKNDLKLGVALTCGYSPYLGIRIGIDMDYLMHISTWGASTYLLVNVGMLPSIDASLTDEMVGFAYGIPISRFFEIAPYVTGGIYSLLSDEPSVVGYGVEPGARFSVRFYPFSLTVGVGYPVAIIGDVYASPRITGGVKWTF